MTWTREIFICGGIPFVGNESFGLEIDVCSLHTIRKLNVGREVVREENDLTNLCFTRSWAILKTTF